MMKKASLLSYLDYSLDVSMAFSEVQTTQFRGTFPVLGVGGENRPSSLTLGADNASHVDLGKTTCKCSTKSLEKDKIHNTRKKQITLMTLTFGIIHNQTTYKVNWIFLPV